MLGDSPAAGSAPRVSAACWLATQAGPKDVGGILAVGTASRLVLIVVTMRWDMLVSIHAGAAQAALWVAEKQMRLACISTKAVV